MNIFQEEAVKARFSLSLHALRGIASVIVLCGHVMQRSAMTMGGLPGGHGISGIPFNGNASVIFFFVLSGLVLGMSLAKEELTVMNYSIYAIRRAFRIIPLFAVTMIIGMLYIAFIDPSMPIKFVPDGLTGYSVPNPPTWSIYVELVVSAFLPFMVLAGRNRRLAILVGAGFLILGSFHIGQHSHLNLFMIDFFLGVTVLWWGRAFTQWISCFSHRIFWSLVAVLFGIFYLLGVTVYDSNYIVFNFMETFSITPLIAIVFFCPQRFKYLERRELQFLGTISYSLYLIHFSLVALCYNLLIILFPAASYYPIITTAIMLIGLPSMCIAIAALSYRYIEKPGIAWGEKMIAVTRHALHQDIEPTHLID